MLVAVFRSIKTQDQHWPVSNFEFGNLQILEYPFEDHKKTQKNIKLKWCDAFQTFDLSLAAVNFGEYTLFIDTSKFAH